MRTKPWKLVSLTLVLALLLPVQAFGQGRLPVANLDDDGPQPRRSAGDSGAQSSTPEYYAVQLKDASLPTYKGGIPGLAATSPTVGGGKLDVTSAASQAYLSYLVGKQAEALASIERALHRPVTVRAQTQYALNALILQMTPAEAARISKLPEVVRLWPLEMRHLLTDAGPSWIGAPGIWNGTRTGGLPGNKGEGIIIGVLDTGINHDHPSFADAGGDGYNHTNPFGSGNYVGVCNPADPDHNPAVFDCTDKLIGGYLFNDFNPGNVGPEDEDGHGSHVSSTAAGNVVTATISPSYTSTVTLTQTLISGVAPHANVIMYDVCGLNGCANFDSVLAIDQALQDGVDVINYSISGGPDPYEDLVSLAFLSAREAGVFVAAAAGNEGPAPGSIQAQGHNEPWLLSVAASNHNRAFSFTGSIGSFQGGTPPVPDPMLGGGITGPYGPARLVYAGSFGNALCGSGPASAPTNPFAPGTFNGEIVVCNRGTYALVDKARHVREAGGGGVIIANVPAGATTIFYDIDGGLPYVHLSEANGTALKAWITGTVGAVTGTIGQAVASVDLNSPLADAIAAFSNRGPSSVPDLLKPDITAPGVSILAATRTSNPANPPEFGFLQGTSMASPHMAGAAALMTKLHPDWSPAEIQSALMSTSNSNLPHSFFSMGAGRTDLTMAGMAGFVLDETTANFEAADPSLGGDPSTLNLPSMAQSTCVVNCSWTRTLSSTLSVPMTWTVSALDYVTGMTATVAPTTFVLPPYGTQMITVTANVTGLAFGDWGESEVFLTPALTTTVAAHMPVVAQSVPSNLPSAVEITTLTAYSGTYTLSNLEASAITSLVSNTYGLTRAITTTASLVEDPTNSDPYDAITGTVQVTVTVPVTATRLVAEIVRSEAPDIDLYVGFDVNGDGLAQEAELVCASATGTALEYCSIPDPGTIAAGTWWILAQNWGGSASQPDDILLAVGVVPDASSGNMTISGPTSVAAKDLFSININWNVGAISRYDRWYGAFDLGTDPGNSGNLGRVDVDLVQFQADIFLPIVIRSP